MRLTYLPLPIALLLAACTIEGSEVPAPGPPSDAPADTAPTPEQPEQPAPTEQPDPTEPPATTEASFELIHEFVGCYELALRPSGGALLAGTPDAAAITDAGAIDPSFGQNGYLRLPQLLPDAPYAFQALASNGLGTGLYGIALTTVSTAPAYVFAFDGLGAPQSGLETPQGTLPRAIGYPRSDAAGTLYASGRTTHQGGFASGTFRVDASGQSSQFVGLSAGAAPLTQHGALADASRIEHYAALHYAVGAATQEGPLAVHALNDDGSAVAGFQAIPVSGEVPPRLALGPTTLYVVGDDGFRIYPRATGAAPLNPPLIPLSAAPLDTKVDADDRLYVLDAAMQLTRYLSDGQPDASFTAPDSGSTAIPAGAERSGALALSADSIWITRCAATGTAATSWQQTSRSPR